MKKFGEEYKKGEHLNLTPGQMTTETFKQKELQTQKKWLFREYSLRCHKIVKAV